MSVDNQLSFPAKGPEGRNSKEAKLRITLKHHTDKDGKLAVDQVEVTIGDDPPILFPDPPAGEGTPPNPPPRMDKTDFDKKEPVITSLSGPVKGGGHVSVYIFCSLNPPLVRLHEPAPGKEDKVSQFAIDHATQDVLVEFLRNPHWKWAPSPAPKQEKAK
jgi:hypothetical protein